MLGIFTVKIICKITIDSSNGEITNAYISFSRVTVNSNIELHRLNTASDKSTEYLTKFSILCKYNRDYRGCSCKGNRRRIILVKEFIVRRIYRCNSFSCSSIFRQEIGLVDILFITTRYPATSLVE